jgi:hypothetical protein
MIANMLAANRYARVLRLLDLERKVILNGPLTSLMTLVKRREAAMTEILAPGHNLPEAFLVALKARAERNSRLILASLAGVKSARARLDEIEAAGDELRTYNAEGTPVEVRRRPTTRDRRA